MPDQFGYSRQHHQDVFGQYPRMSLFVIPNISCSWVETLWLQEVRNKM